jgi:hypothetical protein
VLKYNTYPQIFEELKSQVLRSSGERDALLISSLYSMYPLIICWTGLLPETCNI